MENDEVLHKSLTSTILKSAFLVSNTLGAGFLESVYQHALEIALTEAGIAFRAQAPIEVSFHGLVVGRFYADIVIEGSVIVELKACRRLVPEHRSQVLNYLCASQIPVGLLFNFGNPRLEYARLVRSSLQQNSQTKEAADNTEESPIDIDQRM